ncbi:MAG: Ig-like domain-containing protein, partial [bacterium]
VDPTTAAYLSKVSFFIDGLQVNTDSTPPFQYTVNISSLTPGVHTIRILGVFADGSLLGYDTITVTVNSFPSI